MRSGLYSEFRANGITTGTVAWSVGWMRIWSRLPASQKTWRHVLGAGVHHKVLALRKRAV